jgi:hypothetical protein
MRMRDAPSLNTCHAYAARSTSRGVPVIYVHLSHCGIKDPLSYRRKIWYNVYNCVRNYSLKVQVGHVAKR